MLAEVSPPDGYRRTLRATRRAYDDPPDVTELSAHYLSDGDLASCSAIIRTRAGPVARQDLQSSTRQLRRVGDARTLTPRCFTSRRRKPDRRSRGRSLIPTCRQATRPRSLCRPRRPQGARSLSSSPAAKPDPLRHLASRPRIRAVRCSLHLRRSRGGFASRSRHDPRERAHYGASGVVLFGRFAGPSRRT